MENDNSSEVTRYAELMLRQADVGDRLPTPVDEIVACAKLIVSKDITLSVEHAGFLSRSTKFLRSALLKAKGLIDLREKTIYLDTTSLPQRQSFVKLHEVGHEFLPWQRTAFAYLDDESTLSLETKELFEREANQFASEVLFQSNRFDLEARDLPLDIKSSMHLAKRYGASIHAAARRFVRTNHRSCALLVVEREQTEDESEVLHLRSVEESKKFRRSIGRVVWPEYLGPSFPATALIQAGRKWYEGGRLVIRHSDGSVVTCVFQLFDNSYNAFILVYPRDEPANNRTKFVVTR